MSGAARTIVITGANTGIGRATAVALARGADLILAGRSEERTRPALDELCAVPGVGSVRFVPLDLTELASVRRCAEAIRATTERIDVLVNNAGLGGTRGITKDGFELAFGVNHLGHYLLTRLLLDRLGGEPSRVVHVSSNSHRRARGIDFERVLGRTRSVTGLPEYAVSKLCNVLFHRELARRVEPSRVASYALEPGRVASDGWRHVPWPIRPLMKLTMKTNEEGAATSVYCATAPELEGVSGRYYAECREVAPSAIAEDDALAQALWERSAEWVGLPSAIV